MMKTINFFPSTIIIVLSLSIISICSAATKEVYNIISSSNESVQLKHWQISKDLAPKEVLRESDNSSWLPVNSYLFLDKYSEGNWLLKTEIIVDDSLDNKTVLGIFPISFITACEIYWDGIKIAQNGIIGFNNSDEKAGIFNFNLPLPSHFLIKGKHTIILRISNHQDYSPWKWYYGRLEIGPYETVLSAQYKTFFQSFLFMGLLCIPFLFNIFLYFARNKKPEHLLFSLICLIVFLDSTIAAVPSFINLSTSFIHLQYDLYNGFTLLFSILLPVFFVYFFSFSRKLILPIAVSNIAVMLLSTTLIGIFSVFNIMSLTLLVISTAIVGWAVKEKRENSLLILFGVVVGWISYFFNIAFAGFATIMVICVSFSVARQFAKSERAESEANLKSARLENELLKKNINPHFLLNTLTSIIAWLRKEPESAIKLVEALALEFRMINQISSLKTIPMNQEIELCRTHLQIMNYRKKSNFTLETFGLIDDEQIPPMIFHTLIENGLTHGYENKSVGVFILKRTESDNVIQYRLSNDGEYNENEHPQSSGVGFNYIKGRLEETFSGRWNLASHQIDNGWETVIEIGSK